MRDKDARLAPPCQFILFNMVEFDVFQGMDRLCKHHAYMECLEKTMVCKLPSDAEFYFCAMSKHPKPKMVSSLKTIEMLKKSCVGFLVDFVMSQPNEP